MNDINLDHLSANPLLPEVKEAMIKAVRSDYANPSSLHQQGEHAAELLAEARKSVSALINAAEAEEIVFTSGGTESVNHAVKGAALAHADKGKHIITSNIEHNAVIRSLRMLQKYGFKITSVSVDQYGTVDPQKVADAITDQTVLVSIMHGSHEIGTLQPIKEIARLAEKNNILFHTDAAASVGVVPVDVQDLGVDLMSFAANTFYGPPGVGGLYIRKGTAVANLLDGGVQEHNKRGGTENLIGIIGAAAAAESARKKLDARYDHLQELKTYLLQNLPDFIDEYHINNHPDLSLPHLLSLSIKYIEGESILLMLDDEGIAVATRSACATGSLRASHVLLSIGRSHADAQGTIVIGLGIENTKDDIIRFLSALKRIVTTLREISPLYGKTRSA